jgi:hypothetical protein
MKSYSAWYPHAQHAGLTSLYTVHVPGTTENQHKVKKKDEQMKRTQYIVLLWYNIAWCRQACLVLTFVTGLFYFVCLSQKCYEFGNQMQTPLR